MSTPLHNAAVNSEVWIMKKPTGSPFPAAKNLSKLKGDQVSHLVFEPDSSCPLHRCITDQNERRSLAVGSKNLRNEKSPHRCNRHWREQPAWAMIECVLHTSIIIRWGVRQSESFFLRNPGIEKPAHYVGCTQWAGEFFIASQTFQSSMHEPLSFHHRYSTY